MFIINEILKPLLVEENYEEYIKIYNKAFLTEHTAEELKNSVESDDIESFYVDKLNVFFAELDTLTMMQWLNVLGDGDYYVYSYC